MTRGSITFIHGLISYVSLAGTGTGTAVAPAPIPRDSISRRQLPPIVQLQTCSVSDLHANLTECNCAAGMGPPSTPVGSSGKPQGGSFRGPFSGPAQERYGSYLGKVLAPSNAAFPSSGTLEVIWVSSCWLMTRRSKALALCCCESSSWCSCILSPGCPSHSACAGSRVSPQDSFAEEQSCPLQASHPAAEPCGHACAKVFWTPKHPKALADLLTHCSLSTGAARARAAQPGQCDATVKPGSHQWPGEA